MGGGASLIAKSLNSHGGRFDYETETFVTSTMTKNGDSHSGFRDENGLVNQSNAVRRLTPLECERLQGFKDNYTRIKYRGKTAADGPRYEAIGNSMAVPVMKWIGERIQMVDKLKLSA